jgi:hypothetical protein
MLLPVSGKMMFDPYIVVKGIEALAKRIGRQELPGAIQRLSYRHDS